MIISLQFLIKVIWDQVKQKVRKIKKLQVYMNQLWKEAKKITVSLNKNLDSWNNNKKSRNKWNKKQTINKLSSKYNRIIKIK